MMFARLRALYRHHFRDHRRERMVLASVSFFATFLTCRVLVLGFRSSEQPLRLVLAGVHVHHYVWGILLLLVVGYLWLIQVGTSRESVRLGRITAVLYGAAAALTLDEFALWLHLEDVYWERTGRASIDAVLLFGAMVSAGVWGGPFWRAVLKQIARLWRRGAAETAEVAAAATAAVAEAATAAVAEAAAAAEDAPALDFTEQEPVPEPVLASRSSNDVRIEP
jgi:hypothetical protein